MYLYVTENIDYYHKIGIADDYYSRLKNYSTYAYIKKLP